MKLQWRRRSVMGAWARSQLVLLLGASCEAGALSPFVPPQSTLILIAASEDKCGAADSC